MDNDAALRAIRAGAVIELGDGKRADPQHVAVAAALAEAAKEFDLHSILAFHDRVANSKRFDATLAKVTSALKPERRPDRRLVANHIDASSPGHVRRQLLDGLDDPSGETWQVLSSVRTIAEGVDVPAIDCVVFVDPRKSAVDVVQAVGRALRPNPNRQAPSVIVVPVYVTGSSGGEESVDLEEFESLWYVIDAMRKEDERLEATYERIGVPSRPKPRGEAASRPHSEAVATGEKILLPNRLVPQFLASIRPRLITRRVRIFQTGLDALDEYIKQCGDPDVPVAYVGADGFGLGKWVQARRKEYRLGLLAPEHVLELESRGMIWSGFDAKFRAGIRALRAWREANPGKKLSQNTLSADGFAVGKWAFNWCHRYAIGDAAEDRVRTLRAYGVPVDQFSPLWQPGFSELESYLADARIVGAVPSGTRTASGFHLGLWFARQRERYLRCELSMSEFEALDRLGVLEGKGADDNWEKGLAQLRAWVAWDAVEHRGPGRPPSRPNVFILRRCYDRRRGVLTEAQRLVLAELGVRWAGAPIREEQAA